MQQIMAANAPSVVPYLSCLSYIVAAGVRWWCFVCVPAWPVGCWPPGYTQTGGGGTRTIREELPDGRSDAPAAVGGTFTAAALAGVHAAAAQQLCFRQASEVSGHLAMPKILVAEGPQLLYQLIPPLSCITCLLLCMFIQVPEVTVSILPAASMHQQRIVLQVTALRPHVTAVQGSNFSWLGYPADTTPSSRDFLPGLTAEQQQQQDDDEGGTEDGEQAAAATEGEEDEGSEQSEGSGVTLGPPVARQDSSTSSSSSTVGGWNHQVRLWVEA